MCILRDVPVRRANSRVVGVKSVVALRSFQQLNIRRQLLESNRYRWLPNAREEIERFPSLQESGRYKDGQPCFGKWRVFVG